MSMAGVLYFKVEWTLFIRLFGRVGFELYILVNNGAEFHSMEVSS